MILSQPESQPDSEAGTAGDGRGGRKRARARDGAKGQVHGCSCGDGGLQSWMALAKCLSPLSLQATPARDPAAADPRVLLMRAMVQNAERAGEGGTVSAVPDRCVLDAALGVETPALHGVHGRLCDALYPICLVQDTGRRERELC